MKARIVGTRRFGTRRGWLLLLCCLILAGLAACSSGGVGRPPDPDPDPPDPFPTSDNPAIDTLDPPSGPVGTAVSIGGEGFSLVDGLNEVRFGEIVAPVTSSVGNRIETIVPEGAVTSLVTVTVNGRTSNGQLFIVTSMLNTRRVSSLVPGGDRQVWLGTRGGLALLDTFTGVYKNFFYSDGLKSDYVLDLIPWAEGLLILTNKGLQYLSGTVEDPVVGDVCPEVTFAGFERHLDRLVLGTWGRAYLGSAHYGLVEISGDPLAAECAYFPWDALPIEYDESDIDYSPYIGIIDLATTIDGMLWMIYEVPAWESRLAVFRPIVGMPALFDVIQYTPEDFPAGVTELFSIGLAEDETIYIGADSGYYRLDGDPFEALTLTALSPVWATNLAYEQTAFLDGEMVMATFDAGLVRFDPDGGDRGEGAFTPIPRADDRFTSAFDEPKVTDLAVDPQGDLLIGTVDGVSIMKGSSHYPIYRDFTTGVAFPQDFISDLVLDENGNLVSIDLNSLCVLVGLLHPARPDFRYMPNINAWSWGESPSHHAGLYNVSLAAFPDGRVARGTEFAVTLFDFTPDYSGVDTRSCSLAEEVEESVAFGEAWPPWINEVSVREDGTLFVGTSDGVCRLDESTGEPGDYYDCPLFGNELLRDEVRHVAFDGDGDLIIGTWCEGLWSYDFDEDRLQWHPLNWVSPNDRASCKEYRFFPGEGVREFFYVADSILSIAAGNDTLYVGTTRGLFLLDPDTKAVLEHFPFYELAKRSEITSMAIDSEGNVFMVRANLNVGYPDYRDDVITVFNGDRLNPRFFDITQDDGLPSAPYRSIVVIPSEIPSEDEVDTNLYITVNDGGGLATLHFYRPLFDADGDGIPDVRDPDDDGDGIPDLVDPHPVKKAERDEG